MRKLFLYMSIASITFFMSLGIMTLFDSPPLTTTTVVVHTSQPEQHVNPDEQILREIYREYGPAQTNHDRAFFERVESDRFILFDRDRNLNREEAIRGMESWPRDTVYQREVESIRFIGSGAVVIMRMHARSNIEVDSYRSVDVWIKDGDRWQILSTTELE